MTTNIPHPCLHITFCQGEPAVSFIAIYHSTPGTGISCVTCFGQLDISKYNVSMGWKVLMS